MDFESSQEGSEAKQMIKDLAMGFRGKSHSNTMAPLAPDYVPGEYDVICARGKHAKNHTGNVRYRKVIVEKLTEYDCAPTKVEKSAIVSTILDDVREKSPQGGFIKEIEGRWHEVGDHIAREKIGQSLRDMLHTKYSSSTKAKKIRRKKQESQPLITYSNLNRLSMMGQNLRQPFNGVSHDGLPLKANTDVGLHPEQQIYSPNIQSTVNLEANFSVFSRLPGPSDNLETAVRLATDQIGDGGQFHSKGNWEKPTEKEMNATYQPLAMDTTINMQDRHPSFVAHLRSTFLTEMQEADEQSNSSSSVPSSTGKRESACV